MGDNAAGNKLTIYGSCGAEGNLKLEGDLQINGSLSASTLEANEIKIEGSMTADETTAKYVYVGEDSRVRGILKADTVEVDDGGRVDHIIANKVKLGEDARIGKLEANDIEADPSAKYK